MDFKNTVIIMTSNIGSHHLIEGGNPDDKRELVLKELRGAFRPGFLNRVDETIVFHQLDRENFHRIVDIQLERVGALLADRRIQIEVTDEARDLLATKGYDPHYGARPLKRVIQRMLQDPLAMRILEGEFPEGSKVQVDARLSGDALELYRRIRAFNPFPVCFTTLEEQRLKVWSAQQADGSGEPGSILAAGEEGLLVACGSGALLLTVLQLPGGKPLPVCG